MNHNSSLKELSPSKNKKNYGSYIVLGAGAFIVALFFIFPSKENKIDSKLLTTNAAIDTIVEIKPIVTKQEIEEICNKIELQLTGENNWTKAGQLSEQVHTYSKYYTRVINGKETKVDSVVKSAEKLEKLLVKLQAKEFPKLREAYCKIAKEKLWENNVDVKHLGKPYTTIEFTGGYFASNMNIKNTQETINEIVKELRFKKINYKWYKGADDYTYYTLETPNDKTLGSY